MAASVELPERSEAFEWSCSPSSPTLSLTRCCRNARGSHAGIECVVLSIVAGTAIEGMLRVLGANAAIVRAMPNTPAAIGEGMTVLTASTAVTSAQRSLCSELLVAVGAIAWTRTKRRWMRSRQCGKRNRVRLPADRVSRASGARVGLAPALARQLATQTAAGASAYARAAEERCGGVAQRVTTQEGRRPRRSLSSMPTAAWRSPIAVRWRLRARAAASYRPREAGRVEIE